MAVDDGYPTRQDVHDALNPHRHTGARAPHLVRATLEAKYGGLTVRRNGEDYDLVEYILSDLDSYKYLPGSNPDDPGPDPSAPTYKE